MTSGESVFVIAPDEEAQPVGKALLPVPTAEIITEDMRLIERLLAPLRKLKDKMKR